MDMFRQWRVIVGLVIVIVIATVAISSILPVAAAPKTTATVHAAATATPQPLAIPAACAGQTTLCPLAISLVNQQGQVRMANNLSLRPQPETNFAFGTVPAGQSVYISGNDVNLVIALLNPTNASETLTTVELRLVSFTPFNGTIANAFAACDQRVYANGTAKAPTKVAGTDCSLTTSPATTYGFPVTLSDKLTDGMVIPLDGGATPQGQLTSSSVTVAPYATSNGATTLLDIAITPNRSGTYVFQVGVAVKGHPLTFFDTTLSAFAVTQDAVDRYWSAENCTIPGNRAQVPSSGAYLCPGPVATE
jgi:hypothetical protein